jgi:hypothetical protein
MASHVPHERHDRYEMADVQETKFLHMHHRQQTNNGKNEKTKVRVCFGFQVSVVYLLSTNTFAESVQFFSDLFLCTHVYVELGNDGVVSCFPRYLKWIERRF